MEPCHAIPSVFPRFWSVFHPRDNAKANVAWLSAPAAKLGLVGTQAWASAPRNTSQSDELDSQGRAKAAAAVLLDQSTESPRREMENLE